MISIFIMYSPDRKTYLGKQIEHMRNMPLYEKCQKILVLDGENNVDFEELEIVPLERGCEFNWSQAWNTGVNHCKYEKILYLDSDRLLPLDYLERIEPLIKDNTFVYASNLFTLCLWPGKDVIDSLLNMTPNQAREEIKDIKKGLIVDDTKFNVPIPRYGKNPMSGNTAFTKSTFRDSGGVDPWYEGHGAFADSDYFMKMYKKGANFLNVSDVVELHFGHTKKDDEGNIFSDKELGVMALDNFIYYCKKWSINLQRAVDMAKSLQIRSPAKYVTTQWMLYD